MSLALNLTTTAGLTLTRVQGGTRGVGDAGPVVWEWCVEATIDRAGAGR